MKVECAACQARYQIPDERVAGRKLKIRCRKCGGAIIVRGDQLIAPVDETTQQAPPGYASAEWHVSLDGDQHGPYAIDQMATMLRAGQLSWEAHVWRDGYSEWRVAGDSDTLVRAVAANATAAEDDGPTRMVQGSVPPDELQPVARSAFAQRAAQRSTHSQPPIADSGHYASQPPYVPDAQYGYENEPAITVDPQYAPQPTYDAYADENGYGYANGDQQYAGGMGYGGYAPPRVSAAQAMTGERNEDSVLFSTKNLKVGQSSPAVPAARGGYAGGEGSGLIDIRALAALARTSQAPSPTARTNGHSNGSGNGHAHGRDEVLALANQTGAFGRLDSLAPFERPAQQSSNAVPLAIVAGSAMVAAAAFLGVYLTRGPAVAPSPVPPAAVAATAQPVAEPEATAAVEPQGAAEAKQEQAPAQAEPRAAVEDEAEDEPAEEASAKQQADDQEVKSALRSIRRPRGNNKRERMAYAASVARGDRSKADKPEKEKAEKPEKAATEASAKKSEAIDDLLLADPKPEPQKKAEPEPAPVETAAPAKAASSSRGRSIDELLDGAVDKSDKPDKKASAAPAAENAGGASGAAETPTRDQVKVAMKSVEGEVKACAAGQPLESPSATVAISVSGATGRVSSVRVTGIQGAVGTCIARAVRGATFPKFSKDTFSINFPFRLK